MDGWIYFGCHKQPGHYLFSEGMGSLPYGSAARNLTIFDGALPPQDDRAGYVATVSRLGGWGLTALGYSLAPMVIDAADHGVPQHRRRLFIVATRSKHPIDLRMPRRDTVTIGSAIEWDAGSWTPINRQGRSKATLQRVESGRARFGQRFVMPYYGSGSGLTGRSLDRPLGTVTTRARWAVVDGDRMRMLSTNENKAAMGFPRDYLLPASPAEAVHLLGNAVVPAVATDIIGAIREAA